MIYTKNLAGNKQLSFLGLGCWRFGEQENPPLSANPGKNYWNGQKKGDSLKIMDLALSCGITHYDTAQAYGLGLSEQFTGQKLRKSRDKVIIATKIIPSSNEIASTIKKIRLSLKRMNTDYIDILYLHWPDRRYDIRYAVEALEEAKKISLIRYTGVSNFCVADMEKALQAGSIDYNQTGYNLIWRHREKDVIPFCISRGISIIAYSFYAQGLLLQKNFPPDNGFCNSGRKNLVFMKKGNTRYTESFINELNRISLDYGYSLPCLLLSWGLSKPWLKGILAGASTKRQLEESINALGTQIEIPIIEKLENLSIICDNIDDTQNIFSHNIISN